MSKLGIFRKDFFCLAKFECGGNKNLEMMIIKQGMALFMSLALFSITSFAGGSLDEKVTFVDLQKPLGSTFVTLNGITKESRKGAQVYIYRKSTAKNIGKVWPSVKLYCGKGGNLTTDFSKFDQLRIEVINCGKYPAPLSVQLKESKIVGKSPRRVNCLTLGMIPPGEKFIGKVFLKRLPTEGYGSIDLSRIDQVDLYMTQTEYDYPLILEKIELVKTKPEIVYQFVDNNYQKNGSVSFAITLSRSCNQVLSIKDFNGATVATYRQKARSISWRFNGIDDQGVSLKKGKYSVWLEAKDGSDYSTLKKKICDVELTNKVFPEAIVWGEPATEKVMLYDTPSYESSCVDMRMGRNQTQAGQAVLLARNSDLKTQVSISSFKNIDTGKAMKGKVELFQVGYVKTIDPARFYVKYVGYWPDLLLPMNKTYTPKKLIANQGQCMPVWIQVKTTKDTLPGQYEAIVKFDLLESGKSVFLPVKLHVYPVTLPDSARAVTALSYAPYQFKGRVNNLFKGIKRRNIVEQISNFLYGNRINLTNIYHNNVPSDLVIKKYLESNRNNAFNVIQIPSGSTSLSDAENRKKMQRYFSKVTPFLEKCRKAGIEKKAYFYGADEIYSLEQFVKMKKGFKLFKEKYPQVPIVTTALDSTYGLNRNCDEVIDIWVPLLSKLNAEYAQKARSRGKHLWWYLCDAPTFPYPNWRVDCSGVEIQLIWWMTWANDIDGVLYWSMAKINPGNTPIKLTGRNITSWNPKTIYNGDGGFFACTEEGVVVPTIRIELIRNGIEDFELLCLLADKGKDGKKIALRLCDQLFHTTYNLTRDSQKFESVRRELLTSLGD